MKNALEIKNLSKTFNNSNFHLDNFSMTIPQGAVMGIVGRNGAGKSTIIKSLFDITIKDHGDVFFYGENMETQGRHLKDDIGVVFDTLSFSEELNAKKLEKVLKDLYKKFEPNLFNQYLNKFKLPRNDKFKTYSRGMTMKLSIAVALSHEAKLLILDEATAGLDPVVREEILDMFLEFASHEENSILMSSHITSDFERIADYITFIDDGKIILSETKDNLIYKYGVARMKESNFEKLQPTEYISYRKRGLQIEALISNKDSMKKLYPEMVIDNAKIDEILPLLTKGDK